MRATTIAVAAVGLCVGCELVFDTSTLSGADSGADGGGDGGIGSREDAGESGPLEAGQDSTLDGGAGDSGNDATAESSPGVDAGCAFPIDLFPCTTIPFFTGQQIVDGLPDEFCGYDSVAFDVAQGGDPQPPDADTADVSAKVVLTMAWDEAGLHLFMHVIQSPVNPPNGQFIWNGDAMEVYASANDVLRGLYGPGADEALHVSIAPPGAQSPTQAATAWWDNGPAPPPLATNLYASRIVADGYVIELYLPWSVIAGQTVSPPDAGSTVALDFSCDIQAPDDAGRAFQSTLGFQAPMLASTPCASAPLQSFCDDRTWCTWILSVK
jgi:hypothetical protein